MFSTTWPRKILRKDQSFHLNWSVSLVGLSRYAERFEPPARKTVMSVLSHIDGFYSSSDPAHELQQFRISGAHQIEYFYRRENDQRGYSLGSPW